MRAPLAAALLLALAAPAYADGYSGGGSGGGGGGVTSLSTGCPASAGQPLSGAVTLTNGNTLMTQSGGGTYNVATTDCGGTTLLSGTNASLVSANYSAGNYFDFKNIGTASVTLTPTSGTIDGATSVALMPGVSARATFDGTNYVTTLLPVLVRGEVSTAHSIYYPLMDYAVSSTGATPTNGHIYCAPFRVDQPFTISEVDAGIQTTASGNVQFAFYAAGIDATSHRRQPQGAAIANSGSISSNSSPATWTVTQSFARGVYYFCGVSDNTSMKFYALTTSVTPSVAWLEGSTTVNGAIGASGSVGLEYAGSFGVWPNFTGATFSELASAKVPLPVVIYSSQP